MSGNAGSALSLEEYERYLRAMDRQVRFLERERQKLSAIVNHMDAGFLVLDRELRVHWANLFFRERFARPGHGLEGRYCWEVLCGREGPCALCPAAAVFRAGRVTHRELDTEDGRLPYITAVDVRSPRGEVEECILMVQDVSSLPALRRSEAERVKREEQFRRVFESVRIGMAVVGLDGRFLHANPELCRILGYAAEELQQLDIARVTHPADREASQKALEEVRSGKRRGIELEKRYLRRDGTVVWGHVSAVFLPSTAVLPSRLVAMVQDITERKRHEEALRRSREQYEALVNTVDGIVWSADAETFRFTFVSSQAERILGYPVAAWLEPGFWAAHVHPEDRERSVRDRRLATAEGRDHVLEYRMLAADGREVWLRDLVTVVCQDGRAVELRGIMVDITGLKTAERALREREAQLHHAQKMEAIGRLAGGVAHDFNNLLTVIEGYTELLSRKLGEGHPLQREVGEIARAAGRAAALTGQLLAFGRRQVFQPRAIQISDVLADAEGLLRRVIGEDVLLEMRVAGEALVVRADPDQVHQVLMNLAVNARDAMPGGGRLTIEADAVELGEGGRVPAGRYVRLRVRDTGQGMSPEVLQRAFEPFFTTKPAGKGTGLGLATVYGVVKQSGGEIFLDSAPGAGTTVEIYLPALEAPAEAQPPSAAPHEAPPNEGLILVVEDDAAVRALTREMLEASGYAVVEAEDARAALELVERCGARLRCVLTDVVMPGMSGVDFAQALAARRPELPVLFMSGYPRGVFDERGIAPVVEGRLLAKPFTARALAQAVGELLSGSRACP